jgi:hypothetical protein
MPNLPISQLPELSASALTGNAEYAIAQDGTTYRIKQSTLNPLPANRGLFAQTGTSETVSGTTTETSLIEGGVGTLSVPANGFQVGDSFRAVLGGIVNIGNGQTIRIRVKTNSSVLLDSGVQTLINNVNGAIWTLNIDFTIRSLGGVGVASIVSLGSFKYTKTNNGTVEGFAFNTVNNTNFDTTIDNELEITVQWGSTLSANNIYSDLFVLNKVY